MYIERQLLVSGEPNKNGRIFPRYLWDRLIKDIKHDIVIGQLDHVDSRYHLLQDTTHLLQNPIVDDEKIYTDIKFLEVPKGIAAYKIIEEIGIENFKLDLSWSEVDASLSFITANLIPNK